MNHENSSSQGTFNRRRFMKTGLVAGAVTVGAGLFAGDATAFAQNIFANDEERTRAAGTLSTGDAAILRFLAAAEIIETDLWQQYNELCGIQDSEVPGGSGSLAFTNALKVLDGDMDQYVHDNTDDEFTHFTFINAYLASRGAATVNLDAFRTLPSSKATGAQQIGRLTNLMQLTLDTSFWTRYRNSAHNPDTDPGFAFSNAIPGLKRGKFAAIPRSDADLVNADHLQAIANTAGFHFCAIEQGGTSLYPSLAQRVNDVEVLQVLLSIGPTEAMHFQTWIDKAGNAPPLTDPTNGLVFPNLNASPFGGENFQTNLIMPEPCPFISKSLPACSIVRPTTTTGAAGGAVAGLSASGLFLGQPQTFFDTLTALATAADAAQRGF